MRPLTNPFFSFYYTVFTLQCTSLSLVSENEKLSKALDDKRLRVSKAGNIAEAALEIHNVMQAAQDAAAHYLEEIRRMREATEKNCQLLLEKARKEADDILAQAKNGDPSDPSQLEEIVKEFGQNNEATGEGT